MNLSNIILKLYFDSHSNGNFHHFTSVKFFLNKIWDFQSKSSLPPSKHWYKNNDQHSQEFLLRIYYF